MSVSDRDAAFRRAKAEADGHEGAYGHCSSPTCLSCDCVDRRIVELVGQVEENTAYALQMEMVAGYHDCGHGPHVDAEDHAVDCPQRNRPAAVKVLLEERERDRRLREGVELILADYNHSVRWDVTSSWWNYRLGRLLSEEVD